MSKRYYLWFEKVENETGQRTNIVKNVPVKINDPDFQDVLPVLVIDQEIAPQTNYGSKLLPSGY